MSETQVKISESTHEILRLLVNQVGLSEQEIIEKAIEQYRRKAFLDGLSDDFLHARSDSEEDKAEQALWDNTLRDGLDKE